MQNGVEPYLAAHAEEFYWERESGHPIHVLRYRAFRPRGVVVISHGFTENAEKYKEIVYYFIKEHFHVYLPVGMDAVIVWWRIRRLFMLIPTIVM